MTDEQTYAKNKGRTTHRLSVNSEKDRVKGPLTSKPEMKKKILSLMADL